jgi:hypothetical protein
VISAPQSRTASATCGLRWSPDPVVCMHGLLRSAVCQECQCMARDHEFLIGRNDVEADATVSRGNRRSGCRIGLRIERASKPGEFLYDACTEGR